MQFLAPREAMPLPTPDVEVEIYVDATLEDLAAILSKIPDSHVMQETLRNLPASENSMERTYKLAP